ncbi:MAG: YqeG family HAD IIIA-type phosphatase [Thermaerobacter sp.]|nr:YqeG family HAD IIIA-type phosphatase [Thermaerobacter sp.]
MGRFLRPDIFLESVYAIDPEKLRRRGIRGLVFDLDMTLVEWMEQRPSPRLAGWLRDLAGQGFRMCILSNNSHQRVRSFAAAVGVPAISWAGKPLARSYRQAMRLMGTTPATTAAVGDQVFTDVWGGNRLHLFTILVLPLGRRQSPHTRFLRHLERWVLRGVEVRHS